MSNIWVDTSLRLLADSLSEEDTNRQQSQLRGLMKRRHPVVIVLGPYNAGKSSLIKRLLVDEGRPVPEWLKISARPQTSESNEIEVLGCIFRDTPGLESRNPQHTEATSKSLADADAFVLLLPPQLVMANPEQVIDILSGKFFGSTQHAPSGLSLLILISHLEEGKADPVEDLTEFQSLKQLKVDELHRILRTQGLNPEQLQILAASPDPYGTVGDKKDVSSTDYDANRSWDGMAEVRDALHSMAAQKVQLQGATQQRYLGYVLRLERARLHGELAKRRSDSAAVEHLAEQATSDLLKFNAFDRQARSHLATAIENEVRQTNRLDVSDIKRLAADLRERMALTIGHWWERSAAELEKTLIELDEEHAVIKKHPSIQSLLLEIQRSLSQVSDPSPVPTNQKWFSAGRKAARLLSDAVHQFAELNFGVSFEKISTEMAKMRGADGFDEYAEQQGRSALLKSAEQVQSADRFMTIASATDALVPALIEFGSLIDQMTTDRRVDQERAKQRQQVTDKLHEIAGKMIDSCWRMWMAQTSEPRTKLSKTVESLASDVARHKKMMEEIEISIRNVDTHLAQVPRMFSANQVDWVGRDG